MKSRHLSRHSCHLLGLFLLVAICQLAAGSAVAQHFDWIESQGPEGGQVNSLAQAPNGDLYAGIGIRGGVYLSTDQGVTWQNSMDYLRRSGIPTAVSTGKVDIMVPGLAIEAVWPNPASSSTTIRYAVPGGQPATLDVYVVAGRLVRRLRHEAGGTGSLEAVWDARDDRGSRVASGTYFLRLQTGIRMVTGKVVVLGDQR